MGEPVPIKLPPGMFRNGTRYETAGRWYDGNLVRWENGRLKPIGGWQAVVQPSLLAGVARGGLTFTDNFSFAHILIGTNSHLYIGEGGVYSDVTPPGFVVGNVDSILGAGYGAGLYGVPPGYGTRRSVGSLEVDAATWQFDTFGNTAVMVSTSDRKIYQFDPDTGLVVNLSTAAVDPAPTALAVFTTNEDFLLAIGAGDISHTTGRKIQWADIGTTTIWSPSDVNSAGDINLNTNGIGMAGARVGLQNLVWTTADVHLINYVGQPAIYAPTKIGTACGLVGPRAWAIAASAAGAGETAYWMSSGGFFQFNGAVTPLPCEVQDYIYDNINFAQAVKIYASTNSRFHEVVWFFPSKNALEIDSYVIYNYKDNIWYFGLGSTLARTTYLDRGSVPLPLGVDASGRVYEHETGYLNNGVSRVGYVFAQSGPAEIGNGEKVIYANLMLADGDGLIDASGRNVVTMFTRPRLTPLGPLMASSPIPFIPNAEGYTPVRFTGRQVALRFESAQDAPWSLGKLRLILVAGGKR